MTQYQLPEGWEVVVDTYQPTCTFRHELANAQRRGGKLIETPAGIGSDDLGCGIRSMTYHRLVIQPSVVEKRWGIAVPEQLLQYTNPKTGCTVECSENEHCYLFYDEILTTGDVSRKYCRYNQEERMDLQWSHIDGLIIASTGGTPPQEVFDAIRWHERQPERDKREADRAAAQVALEQFVKTQKGWFQPRVVLTDTRPYYWLSCFPAEKVALLKEVGFDFKEVCDGFVMHSDITVSDLNKGGKTVGTLVYNGTPVMVGFHCNSHGEIEWLGKHTYIDDPQQRQRELDRRAKKAQ